MKRRRDAPKIRYFDTGPIPIFFGFTTDPKAFARECKRLGVGKDVPFTPNGAPASAHHFTRRSDGQVTSIVTLDRAKCRGRKAYEIHAVMAHEAVHVWQTARKYMGERKPGRETEAYCIQDWVLRMASAYEKGH